MLPVYEKTLVANDQLVPLMQAQQLTQKELQSTQRAFNVWKQTQIGMQQELVKDNDLLEREIRDLKKQIEEEEKRHAESMHNKQTLVCNAENENKRLIQAKQDLEIYGVIKEMSQMIVSRGGKWVTSCPLYPTQFVGILENNQLNKEQKIQALRNLIHYNYNQDCPIL